MRVSDALRLKVIYFLGAAAGAGAGGGGAAAGGVDEFQMSRTISHLPPFLRKTSMYAPVSTVVPSLMTEYVPACHAMSPLTARSFILPWASDTPPDFAQAISLAINCLIAAEPLAGGAPGAMTTASLA